MANITNLLLEVSKPSGWWASIYYWLEGIVLNYGWTILIFTIFVKLLMTPFDFFNRYSSRKNNFIQKRLTGQVQKINEKYKNNREKANAEMQALYKREGYNMFGTCIFSLLNIALTLFVFISFFNTLRNISAYKMVEQYTILNETYAECNARGLSKAERDATLIQKYDEISKDNHWLWIKNIWKNDSSVKVVPDYDALKSATNSASDKKWKNTYFNTESDQFITEEHYNEVMAPVINANPGWNGYFILAILAGVLAYLSQLIADLSNKSKRAKDIASKAPTNPTDMQMQSTMKILKFILPAVSVIFALSNPSAFGIYLITSSLMGIIFNFLIGLIVEKLTRKEEDKYLAFLEKEALNNLKRQKKAPPQMVNYKQISRNF